MRTTEPRNRTETIAVVSSIRCDRCGKETMNRSGYHDREGTTFTLDFGYGSRFDLDQWRFDICDDCAEWLRGEFPTTEVEHDAF